MLHHRLWWPLQQLIQRSLTDGRVAVELLGPGRTETPNPSPSLGYVVSGSKIDRRDATTTTAVSATVVADVGASLVASGAAGVGMFVKERIGRGNV